MSLSRDITFQVGGVSATITLAPGVLAQLPLPLSLSPQADTDVTDVERAACVRLEVVVEAYRDEAETLRPGRHPDG